MRRAGQDAWGRRSPQAFPGRAAPIAYAGNDAAFVATTGTGAPLVDALLGAGVGYALGGTIGWSAMGAVMVGLGGLAGVGAVALVALLAARR